MALEAKPAAFTHLPEEALERYAFGRLAEAELASFEEHLLVCDHCQERLDAEDNFALAMRVLAGTEESAAASAGSGPSSSLASFLARLFGARFLPAWNHPALKRYRAPAWGTALVAILALGVVSSRLPLGRTSPQMADAVTLKTLRGGSAEGMAQAKPDRPLDLSIDFTDAASSLPETGPYRLEVVDAAGNQAWTGAADHSTSSGRITARVERRLGAGVYWVRLYAPSGKLLREFGLRLV